MIPQKANRVVVGRVHLVIHSPHVIERVGLLGDREAPVGAGRIDDAPALVLVLVLEAGEKMHLVAHDRSAEGAAPLGLARVGLVQILLRDEEILVRHRRVGEVADRAAVPPVGALLGDRVDDAGGGGAVLGVELVGDDLELLNRFERRPRLRARAAAAQVVVVAPAVHQVHDAAPVLAVDGDAVGRGVGRLVVDHAGQQGHEPGEVARARRQVFDFTRGHVAADLRRREIDLRRFGRDRDVLFDGADAKHQIDLERRPDAQHEVLLRQPAEALEDRRNLVGARQQARDQERPVLAGDRLADGPALRVGDDDRHPGEDPLLLVGDPAANGGSPLLCLRCCDGDE